jgi:hypothetical protein
MSKANNHLNYLALQQNILGKPLRIGSGPQEGTETEPHTTKNGFKVWLNGKHPQPDFSDIEDHLHIGYMKHPYAMYGMPAAAETSITTCASQPTNTWLPSHSNSMKKPTAPPTKSPTGLHS